MNSNYLMQYLRGFCSSKKLDKTVRTNKMDQANDFTSLHFSLTTVLQVVVIWESVKTLDSEVDCVKLSFQFLEQI